MDTQTKSMSKSELRQRAETLLRQTTQASPQINPADVAEVLQELQIHQIELELQQKELTRANQALEYTRQVFADLFNQAPVGYAVLDENAQCLKINQTLYELLNLHHATPRLRQYNFDEFIADSDRQVFLSQYRTIFNKAIFNHFENRHMFVQLKNMNRAEAQSVNRYVQLDFRLAIPTNEDAEEQQYQRQVLVSVTDISERVALEKALQEEKQRVEQANRAKTEFLAHMSHELRTPLNAIIGFNELLLPEYADPPLSPTQSNYCKQVLCSSKQLLGLIEQLLDISRIESGCLHVDIHELSPMDALLKCEWTCKQLAENAGINLQIDLASVEGMIVLADNLRLSQILLNFISNALKYCDSNCTISVGAETLGEYARFVVKDDGPGIPESAQAQIFQTFHRQKVHEHTQGTGIGLALSAKLAELMNGCVGLESELGLGSTFWVEVPLVRQ
jgi:signal transduction histidine kinase